MPLEILVPAAIFVIGIVISVTATGTGLSQIDKK